MRYRGVGLIRWVAVLLHLLAAKSLDAAIRYVDDSAPPGGNGTSWSHAYRSLKTALSNAAPSDEIRIGKGTYRPAGSNGSRTATFKIKEGMIIQGGYAGYGAPNPNKLKPSKYKTILSGDLQDNDGPDFENYDENSFHVVTCSGVSSATQLRGLYVQGGNSDAGFSSPHCRGGGIRCINGASPAIINCVIRRNTASLIGGGIDAESGAPEILSCRILDNHAGSAASGYGGGAVVGGGTIDDCVFSRNSANTASASGGALVGTSVTVTNSTFKSNSDAAVICGSDCTVRSCEFIENGGEDGGAIHVGGQHVAIIDCTFDSNAAASFAGALFVTSGASATAANCRFVGNMTDGAGNAIANRGSLAVINCLISGNDHPFGSMAAIYNFNQGDLSLTNCTVTHNQSDGPGGGVWCANGLVTLRNCIVWANGSAADLESDQLYAGNGSIDISFCCVQDWTGDLGGEGNFGSNPQFTDANGPDGVYGTLDDDPRLAGNSACRDAGDSGALPPDEFDLDQDGDTAEPIPVDLDFHDRMSGATVDLGAFES